MVKYVVDTMGGNSGSAVEHECRSLVYAVHTHGYCDDPDIGVNLGTAIDHLLLQAALADPQGVCADCNGNDINDECDIDCGAPGCTQPCGGSADCNSNGVPDECEPDEDCQPNGTQDICDIAAGTSEDVNGNRIPDECESPVGACCATEGLCLGLRDECCAELEGAFLGHGVACGPTGACCMSDGTCDVMSESCCIAGGGTFAGADTSCTPQGACCLGPYDCIVTSESCCEALGGDRFMPAIPACRPSLCPPQQGPGGP